MLGVCLPAAGVKAITHNAYLCSVYLNACMYVCIYIRIDTYTHIYIHIYVYTHI